MDADTKDRFLHFLSQTSGAPMGLEVVSASGSRIVAADGREYVDLLAGMGVANVGHRHPKVVEAIREQADRYLHTMVYGEFIQEPQVRLAERLAAALPEALQVAYFTNSGAEAIEGAIKLVRKATGRKRLVAFEGAFHGDTNGALSLGGNPLYRDPFEPLLPQVTHLPYDDVEALAGIDRRTAGVFVEPVQAEGGVRVPSIEFLEALRARCREVGALLVYDEVVTGFGRLGARFAIDRFRVVPDVLVLAKALGGGMPLGAFFASRELHAVLSKNPPLGHVTTFGGHPVSCAAALAAWDVLEEENLCERASNAGKRFVRALGSLPWKDRLAEIRHEGFLIAIEMNDPKHVRAFVARAFEEGVILNWTLHDDRVIRLAPPLNITEDDTIVALDRLARAL